MFPCGYAPLEAVRQARKNGAHVIAITNSPGSRLTQAAHVVLCATVEDSPLTGEGDYLTSRHLKDRLDKELQSNVALRVEPTDERDSFIVSGRGLLHLSVLIETMRREGFEMAVGKPEVILKRLNGVEHEPYEYLVVDVPHGQMGPVMELVGARRGELAKMDVRGAYAHLEFLIPARGLLGLRTRLMSGTQGEAIMHHNFHDYQPFRGEIPKRTNGVMVSMVRGQAVAFALDSLQQRGTMFVAPGDEIYTGMIVAESLRTNRKMTSTTSTTVSINVC